MSAPESLTGVWDGVFSYPRVYKPTPFTAILFEVRSSLSGTIHEVSTSGRMAGQRLDAMVEGSRSANEVRFVKIYPPGASNHGRPIDYVGLVNADATEIEGTWTIRGDWSGKFLMIRSGRQLAAEEVRERQSVPAS